MSKLGSQNYNNMINDYKEPVEQDQEYYQQNFHTSQNGNHAGKNGLNQTYVRDRKLFI